MWAEKYLGISYSEMNCIELVTYVLREEFGKEVRLPKSLSREEISALDPSTLATEVTDGDYRDGDVVILNPSLPVIHAGVICKGAVETFVLHSHNALIGSTLEQFRRVASRMEVGRVYRVPDTAAYNNQREEEEELQ